MLATGRGTLVTRNMLPDDTTRVTSFEGCLFVPGFGTNILSVKKLSVKVTKTAGLFRAGAQFLDAENNLMGYCPEPIYKSDLYPLVCTIISGDVARQHAMHDSANVTDFLQNAAHLQGVPADVMQVQEGATTSLTRGTVETLEQQLAGVSLTDPEAVLQDPLITWSVQVSRREARKLSAALELHQRMCHVNASDMHHAFPSLTALQLQAILQ